MLFNRMELLIDGKVPGLRAVQRALLLRRAARLPQDHRHHVHDHHHDHRRPRPGRRAQVLPGAARAQRDIDLRPELYTHYYKNEFPTRFHDQMDTRRWGPGERIVFEPYTARGVRETRASGSPITASSPTAAWADGQYEGAIVTLRGVKAAAANVCGLSRLREMVDLRA